jgi:hypothetical protein
VQQAWLLVIVLESILEVVLQSQPPPVDDNLHVDLNPQQWYRHRHHLNKNYLVAGAAGVAGAAAFVSTLAGALSSLLAGLASTLGVATGVVVAAAGAAGALAGSAAKAVTANRPAIRVAIVFILNFLLG